LTGTLYGTTAKYSNLSDNYIIKSTSTGLANSIISDDGSWKVLVHGVNNPTLQLENTGHSSPDARNWTISTNWNNWGDFVIMNGTTNSDNSVNVPFSMSKTGAATFSSTVSASQFNASSSISVGTDGSYFDATYPNTLNFFKNTNSNAYGGWINYVGYNGGVTKSRNFDIGDGKQGSIVSFVGETKLTTFHGDVSIPSTTPSTSSSTGALVVGGGIGVNDDSFFAKNLYVWGNLRFNNIGIALDGTNGVDDLNFNYNGYLGGTSWYRNFAVYDGKHNSLFYVKGSTGFFGIGYTSDPTSSNKLAVNGNGYFNGYIRLPNQNYGWSYAPAYDKMLTYGLYTYPYSEASIQGGNDYQNGIRTFLKFVVNGTSQSTPIDALILSNLGATFSGSVTASGRIQSSVSGGLPSLRSLKNINPDWQGNAIDVINQFTLRDFNYKLYPTTDQTLGFIMDELPSSVSKYLINGTGTELNAYSFHGLEIKAIQEVDKRVIALEKEVASLKQQLNLLN